MYNNSMYYNNFFPYQNNGVFKKSLKGINWSNILNNTQKTLNVINQAIPVYYQIKPIWSNAKTMLRMVNALKDDKEVPSHEVKKNTNSNEPVFFL